MSSSSSSSSSAASKREAPAGGAGQPSKRRRSGAENAVNSKAKAPRKRALGKSSSSSSSSKKLLDTRQSKAERQVVRQAYRRLHSETLKVGEDADAAAEMLDRANELFERVLFPSEAVHDAQQIETLARAGVSQARAVTSARQHTVEDLIAAMVRRWRGRGSQVVWHKVGRKASEFVRSAPACNFMNGPLAVPPKRRKAAAQRAKPSKLAEVTRPDLIANASEEEKTQTDQRVESLHRVLKALPRPVPYLRFVVNHESFCQTVENCFDLSFLIKHARASVFLRDGVPYVEARETLQPEELGLEENRIKAIVVSITYRAFLDAVAAFGRTGAAPLVPTRSVENAAV